ncbi:MAG: glycosyltransferase family 2 protein [Acetobacteraceae bacterium]
MKAQHSDAPERTEAGDLAGAAIVIPAFNEAATIGPLVRACLALPGPPRVIVVDDGSADATAVEAAAAGARVLPRRPNAGKGAALRHGFRAALAEGVGFIATMDADGQHDPADIPRLLDAAAAGRVVIGARTPCPDTPPGRLLANRIADFWVSWAARQPVTDSQCGLRVYPAALARRLAGGGAGSERFAFESEALIEAGRAGFAVVAVPIASRYPAGARASHFRPVADIARIVRMVAGKLLARGMDPVGLWRSRRCRGLPPPPPAG